MFFKRKGWLRKEFDDSLISQLELLKEEWMQQKKIVEKSFEPSDEVLRDLKMSETKYFYLLREAKNRKVFLGKR